MKKTLIFDFDGVIIDTSTIKSNAFKNLFDKYSNEFGNFAKAYHLKNEGISRFEKFDIIKNKIKKKQKNIIIKTNELDTQYSKLILKKILNKKISHGFIKFLKNYKKKFNFFISSSMPANELSYILNKKKIDNHFMHYSGYPPKKNFQIIKIIKNFNIKKKDIFYIGDTINDYNVANELNIKFIGYIKYGNKINLNNINIIKNFNEIINITNK